MDYKKQTETLRRYIDLLKKESKAIREAEDNILSIEQEVSELDRTLPDADRLFGNEREQVLRLYDLVNEAFQIIDETVGPPRDEMTGETAGTAYMPEARGTGGDFSLDDILSSAKKNPGRHLS